MFVFKISSKLKHFETFNFRNTMFEMQEFFKPGQIIIKIPNRFSTFWKDMLSHYEPDWTLGVEFKFSSLDISKILKYLTSYELNILKEISFCNPILAMNYVCAIQQPTPELEPILIIDALVACSYACDILQSRFELGEQIISKCSVSSYLYAKYALDNRFELGEPTIMMDHYYKGLYEEYFDIDLKYELNKQNT